MSFLVRDFVHSAPANNNRKVRKLRYGAATAFVDAESGELIAGYSYNTCMYAIVATADHPNGRLYANETKYGVTTARHASWLRSFIHPDYLPRWLPTGEMHEWGSEVTEMHPPLAGWEADHYHVPRGASDVDLVRACHGGELPPERDWHVSTTFASPEGDFGPAYFAANREWLERDSEALSLGHLYNDQRIAAVCAYRNWCESL